MSQVSSPKMVKKSKYPLNLGRHLVVGLEGTYLTEVEKVILNRWKPLGLIFFARNFERNSSSTNGTGAITREGSPGWRAKFEKLIQDSIEVSEGSIKILSIDFEGGRVNRFPSDIQDFPYARDWSGSVSTVANQMADILDGLSINMTYAPVLDVDLEPSNPVIGSRAFSADPAIVAEAGLEFFNVCKNRGILTCGKHFPGHGRSTLDSHFELPRVDISRVELEVDLLPFRKLIDAGIPCIMSSHILFPSIDATFPASLSSLILKDMLRSELGFNGLVFTDDMDMKALSFMGRSECSIAALRAGSDVILIGNGMDSRALLTADNVLSDIRRKLGSDQVLTRELEQSQERILALQTRK